MTGAFRFSIRPNGATFWRSLMIATVAPRPSSQARSPSNIGTKLSATPPSATPSWIASFTTLTAFNSPEKACENRTPAIKLLTPTQTPEPITMSVKAAAHDRAKSVLTISEMRNEPITIVHNGDTVATRPLDFYQAVGQRMAHQDEHPGNRPLVLDRIRKTLVGLKMPRALE